MYARIRRKKRRRIAISRRTTKFVMREKEQKSSLEGNHE
jgi:hypothetical protein